MKTLPPRNKVKPADCWDLASLFKSDDEWEQAFKQWESDIPGYTSFAGTLGKSAERLAELFEFDIAVDRAGDRLSTYAFLKTAEDVSDSKYQDMMGRYRHAATRAGELASFIRPEILAIATAKMKRFLADEALAPHRITLERILRYKQHTLSPAEEKLLAMQGQMAETSNHVFRQLNDSDLKFGFIKDEKGKKAELSTATFSVFLHSPKRSVRKDAFHQFYEEYSAHENTLAAALAGSIHRDVYYAKARNYQSARAGALFADNMPLSVYDNLIASVHRRLPGLYRYYDVRRRKMKLKEIHHYDTYVPILSELETRHTWQRAVKLVVDALEPLGNDYCGVLEQGLDNGWCDRYPNKGKQSGAFSSGMYDSQPYILMNYQPDVLDHVFTLAHEAGHSMHTHYSAKSQPYQYYHYTIFVAEVASTFNEQLLSRHMRQRAGSDEERAYLINRDIDAIRGTIFRQTMFAEFEKITHELAEAGEALTVAKFKTIYRELLNQYFGPDFAIDEQLALECFRIPHFYRAFYVYKYATGLSAAIALSERVTSGGQRELEDYLNFLRGGCSKWPLDLLRDAGVDMEKPEPVGTALAHFDRLVEELDELV
ncbi:MAG: oligoendopeptidase F [Pirellulales bacterium]